MTIANKYNEYLSTPAGLLELNFIDGVLCQATFSTDLHAQPTITSINHVLKINPTGTAFQQAVWQAAMTIKPGQTKTYHELAAQIGRPKAYRAVANALGKNPLAYIIPCHRVIRADGSLGGYKWGIVKKIELLASEKK